MSNPLFNPGDDEAVQHMYDRFKAAIGIDADHQRIIDVNTAAVGHYSDVPQRIREHSHFSTSVMLVLMCAMEDLPLTPESFTKFTPLLYELCNDSTLPKKTLAWLRKKIHNQPNWRSDR